MGRKAILIEIALVFISCYANAQTTVTNSNNGTTGKVPVYTGTATLSGTSTITQSGSYTGIGTTTPSYTLDVRTTADPTQLSAGNLYNFISINSATSNAIHYWNAASGIVDIALSSNKLTALDAGANVFTAGYELTGSGNLGTVAIYNARGNTYTTSTSVIDSLAAFQADLPSNYSNGTTTISKYYGLLLGSLTSTGYVTQGYGIYQTGTSDLNYFAGAIGVGTTSPASLFSVGASSQFQVSSSGAVSTSGGLSVSSGSVSFPSASVANSALQGGGYLTVAAGSGLSGGGAVALGGTTALSLPTVGAAGTYGSSTQVPVITTDVYGRITGVTNTAMAGASSSWSALANPTANLAVSSGAYTTTFTAGSATGTNDLFKFIDTSSNNGTGNLINISTAANSTLKPLAVYAAGGSVPSIQVLPTGSVGIGTTNPGASLEVNGNVKLSSGSGASITFADGTVQSTAYTGVVCGGDFAESVDVTGNRRHYEPGDLLVIDPKHPGDFLKSDEPYSTFVTGIYSTKPGTVGRRQTGPPKADEVPMAMVDIVPTKVSAENGAIHPGDLLVTSSTVGYAMKGTDRGRMLGAVIGKALGSLDKGTGIIEVVVTLQ